MKNFRDSIIDLLADAKEKFAGILAARRNPELALMLVVEKIQTSIEDDLNEIIKENSNDPVTLGLICKASIVSNIEAFKSSETIQIISGLNKSQYDLLIDKVAKEIMNKYFE